MAFVSKLKAIAEHHQIGALLVCFIDAHDHAGSSRIRRVDTSPDSRGFPGFEVRSVHDWL
jgi:hypothetical protein